MSVQREALPFQIFRKRNAGETNENVEATADRFRDRYNGEHASVEDRKGEATTMVNEYYDLVTDFYEYGWGQAFHFAPRYVGESFYESIARHEYFLALQGGFVKGMKVLDLGCGVGGPARNIVRFTGCSVLGVNNNEYQISRARRYDSNLGLHNHISYAKADFCATGFDSNSHDGAYAIEATCHATDKVKCYSEIFRVLKPGSCFVCYEWIITDKYDHSNEEHRSIRHSIELGNSLPTLETAKQVVKAMEDSGFVVEDNFDVCERFESGAAKNIPWYDPLTGSYTSISGFKATPIGRAVTSTMCVLLEKLRIAPKGSHKTAEILEEAAVSLVRGGELGIFTPSFFVKARKPLSAQ